MTERLNFYNKSEKNRNFRENKSEKEYTCRKTKESVILCGENKLKNVGIKVYSRNILFAF